MAYSTNPYLPKARAAAMRLLVEEGLPSSTVVRRTGVHRSTIWRWKRKWDVLNKHVQLTNDNRPQRIAKRGVVVGVRKVSTFRLAACTWRIPTLSSRPRTSPHAVQEHIVQRVLALRAQLKRCAEVVWHYATAVEGLVVSLSSVRRILRRHHCFDGARKPRVRRDNPRRPRVERPGELVEIDTIHHVPLARPRPTGRRRAVKQQRPRTLLPKLSKLYPYIFYSTYLTIGK